ncbi:hypothetical protein Mmc1_0916 [Magnetococcus marinus MC-1]|uniref:Uncharacterized protein n=1 Tax=Magnetococcus marinus (strain ATCC BAA-1437 / JCM 17883 / MC-1) TaxID=156889 RepID=A0L642_MAGMM|nr:hypothetical protein [Magnetococcus marinus]ABK43435.1 hypothetical protein Mmc1_0916 [Magnetococcus marinus MC-1]
MDQWEQIVIKGGGLNGPVIVSSLQELQSLQLRLAQIAREAAQASGEAEPELPQLLQMASTPMEPVEISYLEGPHESFFNMLELDLDGLVVWFQQLRELKQPQRAALYFLRLYRSHSLPEALELMVDLPLLAGDAADVLEEIHEMRGDLDAIPDPFVRYIDWARMAQDWLSQGTLVIFQFEGVEWVVLSPKAK